MSFTVSNQTFFEIVHSLNSNGDTEMVRKLIGILEAEFPESRSNQIPLIEEGIGVMDFGEIKWKKGKKRQYLTFGSLSSAQERDVRNTIIDYLRTHGPSTIEKIREGTDLKRFSNRSISRVAIGLVSQGKCIEGDKKLNRKGCFVNTYVAI